MLGDITLGQYYPVKSPVHSLDPRGKILLLIAFIVGVFLAQNLIAFIPVVIYLVVAARFSRLPLRLFVKSLKPLRFILIFTFLINVFFLGGEKELIDWWIFRIIEEGLKNAVLYSLRLIMLVLGSSLLTLTTSPIALTDGLERLLSPLRVIRFPAHEMAMMMTIALRFIPTLL